MKSVWVYAPAPQFLSWFDALAPSLAEAGIEHKLLPTEDLQGGVYGLRRSLTTAASDSEGGVLCVTEASDPLLSDINRACRAASMPLLLVAPSGDSLQVGPGVVFGTSPCLACFENHNKFLRLDNKAASASAAEAGLAASTPRADGFMLREVVGFLSGSPAGMLRRGYVFSGGAEGGEALRYRVLKNPTCMVCSVFAEHPTESMRVET
jgi:bacteriocin biosynthesis cyclodehydratase domain-containing protein